MEKHCRCCNKRIPKTREKRSNELYCSRICYNADHHVTTCCKICNVKFIHHRTKKRKFCSISCANKSRYPITYINCSFCDKEFRKSNDKTIFCSSNCYIKSGKMSFDKIGNKNPTFTNGIFSYKNKALRELPQLCAICASVVHLEVHHIDNCHLNSDLSNLIILCRRCHYKYHSGKLDFDSF